MQEQHSSWRHRNWDGDEAQRKARLLTDLKTINGEHDEFIAFSNAAQATIQLVAVLTKDPELARDFGKAVAAVNAANELVRSMRAISAANDNGLLFSAAGMGAYASGVTAAITLISVFSSSDQPSELQMVVDYLDQRLDVVDAKLDVLLERTEIMDRKLDALLQGQTAIMQAVARNARAVDANRFETLLVRQALSDLEGTLLQISTDLTYEIENSRIQNAVEFRAQEGWVREERILQAGQVLGYWLTPDNTIIKRLNDGTITQAALDEIQREKQRVVSVINLLSGPTFVRPIEVLIQHDALLGPGLPAQEMAKLPTYIPAITELSDYMREHREPDFHHMMNDSYYDDAREIAARIHQENYPHFSAQQFENLPNPDALNHILQPYFTFYLALTPEARRLVGFSELGSILKEVERLSQSVSTAQAAALVIMSQLQDSMAWVAEDLEEFQNRGRLFRSYNDELRDYIFKPGKLHFPDDFLVYASDTDKDVLERAEGFSNSLSADEEAIDWLSKHSDPYFKYGLRTNGKLHLTMLERIKVNPSDWRISQTNENEEWIRNSADASLLKLSLDVLADLRALYDSYKDGDLFEYSREELTFIDAFLEKPILSIGQSELVRFLEMIKSDKQLLQLAIDEEMVVENVIVERRDEDLLPNDPNRILHYATVRYETYHNGKIERTSRTKVGGVTVGKSSFSAPFSCYGARLNMVGNPPSWLHRLKHQAFPMDTGGGGVRGVGNVSQEMNYICSSIGKERGFSVYNNTAAPYDDDIKHEARRDASMVPNGTKLYVRGVSHCKSVVNWNSEIAKLPGIDTSREIAVMARYFRILQDNPRAFPNAKQVREANRERLAPDGTPLRENFEEACKFRGQDYRFNVYPGPARIGAPKPALVVDTYWKGIPNSELMVHELRKGMALALLKRRSNLVSGRLQEIASRINTPPDVPNRLLIRMDINGVDRDVRRELITIYREQGSAAFWSSDIVGQFYADFPSERALIDQYRAFVMSRQLQPKLLRAFAEWGFGLCYYQNRDLEPWALLTSVPVPDTNLSVPQAFKELVTAKDPGRFGLAALTLTEGHNRLRTAVLENRAFPPQPEDRAWEKIVFDQKYLGIHHETTLKSIAADGCELGHGSIVALRKLKALVEREGSL